MGGRGEVLEEEGSVSKGYSIWWESDRVRLGRRGRGRVVTVRCTVGGKQGIGAGTRLRGLRWAGFGDWTSCIVDMGGVGARNCASLVLLLVRRDGQKGSAALRLSAARRES